MSAPLQREMIKFKTMTAQQSNRLLKTVVFLLAFGHFSSAVFSQVKDSTKHTLSFKGSVSVTNNGFSLVPTFSLGEPAVATFLNISGKGRLSFEPEFRYSMKFKPWSLVFIWRYKLIRKEKFQLALGTHLPALNFVSGKATLGGVEQDVTRVRRFFPVVEMMPTYKVSENVSLGIFYLFSVGLEKELTKRNHFVSFQPNFNHIPLLKRYYLRFNPQFYYLKLDERAGFYVAGALTLARQGFPFSVSAMMNKAIDSDIPAKEFDWNVSLNYAFGKKYVKQ